jgi:glycine betaine/proline transport system substrate-binding protein
VNPEFAENAPADLLAFLDNFYWTPLDMGEVMLSIHEHGLDPWEAARNWIADNQDTVQSWLP